MSPSFCAWHLAENKKKKNRGGQLWEKIGCHGKIFFWPDVMTNVLLEKMLLHNPDLIARFVPWHNICHLCLYNFRHSLYFSGNNLPRMLIGNRFFFIGVCAWMGHVGYWYSSELWCLYFSQKDPPLAAFFWPKYSHQLRSFSNLPLLYVGRYCQGFLLMCCSRLYSISCYE